MVCYVTQVQDCSARRYMSCNRTLSDTPQVKKKFYMMSNGYTMSNISTFPQNPTIGITQLMNHSGNVRVPQLRHTCQMCIKWSYPVKACPPACVQQPTIPAGKGQVPSNWASQINQLNPNPICRVSTSICQATFSCIAKGALQPWGN